MAATSIPSVNIKLILLLATCSALWGAFDAGFAWKKWSSAKGFIENQSNGIREKANREGVAFMVEKVNQMKWEAQSQTERACLEFIVLGLLIHWNLKKKSHAQSRQI